VKNSPTHLYNKKLEVGEICCGVVGTDQSNKLTKVSILECRYNHISLCIKFQYILYVYFRYIKAKKADFYLKTLFLQIVNSSAYYHVYKLNRKVHYFI